MKPAAFDYCAPATLPEVVDLLSTADAAVIAGGQSLMPLLAFRLAVPSLLVDLRRVPGLDTIAIDDSGVRLGAKVRWCDIEENDWLATAHPLLRTSRTSRIMRSAIAALLAEVSRTRLQLQRSLALR